MKYFLLATVLLLGRIAVADALPQAELLSAPFTGQFPISNWHDHDTPREFEDSNGYILTSFGEKTPFHIDGHEGYDWLVPEGTPLLAAAEAEVVYAGDLPATFCPILSQNVIGKFIRLKTTIGGEIFYVDYGHASQIDVSVGQLVTRGQQLGLSGTTGCSTGPHLHFSVRRSHTNGPTTTIVDPYGWTAPFADPWAANPLGAESVYLWRSGEAPQRYFESHLAANDCSGCGAPVAITRVRWMGEEDALKPNNEFIEITLDPRFGGKKKSLSGYILRNNKGEAIKLSKTQKITSKSPLRIFAGKGRNVGSAIFANRKKPFIDNQGDCMQLFSANGKPAYFFYVGTSYCRYVKNN